MHLSNTGQMTKASEQRVVLVRVTVFTSLGWSTIGKDFRSGIPSRMTLCMMLEEVWTRRDVSQNGGNVVEELCLGEPNTLSGMSCCVFRFDFIFNRH